MSDPPGPESWPRAATESWPRAVWRAAWHALWVLALIVLAAVTAYTWSRWRNIVMHWEMDLDPRPRVDEMFPGVVDDVPKRVEEATRIIKELNREYPADLALCVAIGAGLIGLPILYRRLIPRATRWPATKRAWLLALPLFAVLGLVALLYVASGLRGALTG